MEEEQPSLLSSTHESRWEILERNPALNIFQNVEQKQEFLKKSIQHYNFLQKTCPSKYGPPPFTEILQSLCQEIDSDLLSSLEFITVSQIVKESGESYCLFLPLTSEVKEKSFCSFPQITERKTNEGKPIMCLPKKKFLLLAKLISGTPDGSGENLSCFLCLSDGSSKIHCQIKSSLCDEMLLLLNKWILITDANVIFSSQLPGILEICSKPIPLGVSCLLPKSPISALNVKSVSFFLHRREKIKPEEICVAGRVTAVSEIVQIKHNSIFLIELSHHEDDGYCFHILLKDEFVHWQQLINPGSSYVFSALRVSTLVKGCGADHVKVLVPCHTCKVWPQKYCHLQEQKGILSEEFEKVELNPPTEKKGLNFTSYQGCITDTNQANDGIFILNHQVRLHLFYIPAIHHFSQLRLGSIIQVYNVHLKQYSEEPKIQLFSCMKSCIKILEFSPLNTLPMFVNFNWAQEMSFSQSTNVNWLLEMRRWLINSSSLLGLKPQRHIDVIWKSFLQSTLNEKTEMPVKPRRNLLQEFFSPDHKCPVESNNVEQYFPSPVCPSNLLEEDFSSLIMQQKQQSADNNMEKDSWKLLVKNIRGTKMLIGYVAVSSVTGHLCLVDQLNSINIICQPWQMEATPGSLCHECTTDCLLQQRGTKLIFPCPFVHSWCLGRLIIVSNYQMVIERFISGSKTESLVKYLRFSLEDICVLNDSVLPSFYSQLGLNYSSKESTDEGNICTCQMFMFIHKESLMGHNLSTANPTLRFTASGYFLGNTFQLPAKDVFRYVTKFPKSEELQNTILDLENICEKEKDTLDGNLYDRVLLLFENTPAQWYNLLQNAGSCYMLVVRGNNLEAFSSCHQASVVKTLRNSNSKYPVQMPQNVIVQELSDWHLDTIYKKQQNSLLNLKKIVSTKMSSHNSPYSISDVISSSFSEDIVSLLPTKILSRSHPENIYGSRNTQFSDATMNHFATKLELSTLGGKSIKLVLQDVKSHDELVLFMNLENTSYPLGLLDGAIVEFHLLQRIVSKKNKVYCKFIAISSVRTLATSHNAIPDTDSRFCSHFPDANSALNQMSRISGKDEWSTLSLILSGFHADRSQLWTLAFVDQMNKLTVKTLCTKCSCLSFQQKCSDKTCNNTDFRVSIYMCLLLDDGSCRVFAYSWSEALLLQILGFSMIQWNDLVDLIHSKWGEMCLESKANCARPDTTDEDSSVQQFMTVLCNSPLVKQKWWMKLKRRTSFAADSTLEQRFPFKEINKIKTRCSPFQQVEILSIQKDSPFDILSI